MKCNIIFKIGDQEIPAQLELESSSYPTSDEILEALQNNPEARRQLYASIQENYDQRNKKVADIEDLINNPNGLIGNTTLQAVAALNTNIIFPEGVNANILLSNKLKIGGRTISGRVINSNGEELFIIENNNHDLIKLANFLSVRKIITDNPNLYGKDSDRYKDLESLRTKFNKNSIAELILDFIENEDPFRKEYFQDQNGNMQSAYIYLDKIGREINETNQRVEYTNPFINTISKLHESVDEDSHEGIKAIKYDELYSALQVYYPNILSDLEIDSEESFKKKIKSVTIPSTMTKISDRAFKLCENLESVEISDGVKEIGKYAFYECTSLKSVNIPSSVTTIGEEAFYRCTNLTSVTFEDPVGWYDSNGGINVSNPTKNAANLKSSWASSGIYKDNSKPGDPETGNSNIVVPDYLDLKGTIITGFDASKLPDDGAVEIPEGVTGIDPDYQVFYFNEKIKTVTIPSTMTTIRDQAFERCFGLESVNIADGVKVIGEGAFESCRILKSVKIPNSVTTIGKKAFYYCENLTDITIPAGVTEISDYAFHDCKLTEITIPDGVTKIGENAFSLCPLTEVNIPSSVTTIGYSAFRDCSNLTDITIPKGVTEISNYAFYNCNLKEITIPASVTKIGIAAFAKNFLKSVTFEDTEGWYDNNEEEIDVSDPTKNAKNLESSWGIYKKTN